MRNFESVEQPLIYLITDGETTAENFIEKKRKTLELIETAVQSKISFIQIREKQISARLVFELASEVAELTRHTATKLLVNDRADIALAAKADGVHLTKQSLSADVIRKKFPKDFIVGVSAHSIEQALYAQQQGADFVTFSPIFFSPGKGAPQGIEKLREVCARLKNFPIIALGGINAANLADTLTAGASGFAAIRFLNDKENLKKLFAISRRS
ncbi:MAG: thiamine phosphate synthase [Pyrinomonadaceae bacterium]|nr:thiamine phosphate synthase [Pyrinomonadaceae bacterium]